MIKILNKIIFTLVLYSSFNFGQVSTSKIDSINSIGFDKIVANLRQSLNIFSENLQNARKINYKKGEGIALSKLALIHYMLGQYDKSTEFYIQSINFFSQYNMKLELADAYGEFGYQLKRRDIQKANDYMRKAIEIGFEIENNEGILSKLFDNYAVLKEMENRLDSALYYSSKALELKFKENDTIGIPFSLNKIAGIYANQKKFKEAFDYLALSDFYRNKEQGNYGKAENMALRADFYKYQGKNDSALYYYKLTLNLADSLNYNYLISYALENLSNIYLAKGDYKNAFEHYLKFTNYKDSLDNLEKNSRIAQLEIAYETEQKDKLIAQSELEIQQRNLWLVLALISIILIVSFSIFLYKNQQQKREIAIRDIELQNEIKRAQLERKLFDEKLRISRELHDNIGSQLTFIISSIDNITYANKANPNLTNLSALKEFSRSALFDLRNTIWAMKEEKGDFEKLYLKVNDFVQRLDSSLLGINIFIQNNLASNYDLSSIQMLNLFRIIQEALQNSVKHSSAKNIQIIFSEIEGKPSVIVKDDGKGFDISKESSGNGLENMKRRSELSNSDLQIKSDENGTSVIISILSN
jgi:signal transduction histidine kinase